MRSPRSRRFPLNPPTPARLHRRRARGVGAGLLPDIDLSRIDLAPERPQAMSGQLATLVAEQRLDQLQRIERSILRLERQNVQILGLLQKLVKAIRKTSDERST